MPSSATVTARSPTAGDLVRSDKPLLRGWSHAGALVATIALAPFVAAAASSTRALVAAGIYLFGVIAMLGASTLLHRGTWTVRQDAVLSRLDHSAIFLAIAGTYTPVGWLALRGWQRPAVLATVWGGALAGLALTCTGVKFRLPRWMSTAVYGVVGWVALLALPQLFDGLGPLGFSLVFGGGVAYTCGAVVYALQRPDPWPSTFGYHEVFHALTIVGVGSHMAAIAFVVLPKG